MIVLHILSQNETRQELNHALDHNKVLRTASRRINLQTLKYRCQKQPVSKAPLGEH